MTKQEFLDALRATPRDNWEVTETGRIRFVTSVCLCPLLVVAGQERNDKLGIAISTLGLDMATASTIIGAADNQEHVAGFVDMRRALLDACGLEEEEPA